MPNYDYRCRACGQEFTVKVSLAEKEQVVCPNCNSRNLQQLFREVNLFRYGSSCQLSSYGRSGTS
jgi:putative FmdB family regulatory protein